MEGQITQSHDEFSIDVEKVYRILRKFHSRVPKLELAFLESGVVVRPGLTERVLNRCGDAGNLKQPSYSHSYDIYKSMIKMLGKMRQFGAVWALIEEIRKESAQVFVVLMRRFASARMVKKTIEVLDEMPKYGCEPDEYVFGCLLDALCKNGSVKEAALLFEDMRTRFEPTIKHFTSLLYVLIQFQSDHLRSNWVDPVDPVDPVNPIDPVDPVDSVVLHFLAFASCVLWELHASLAKKTNQKGKVLDANVTRQITPCTSDDNVTSSNSYAEEILVTICLVTKETYE
ncbi:hypothetical protein RD792_003603 [Penstemon davidsonii]|uniref:Pentatricopeptide repeat-containing protein n=1 Tax=Penstemon davidsonii TaxID=160366 RepID=A0ABR0DG23_9LAMI|nr:hypothetical protein RD792_003603 [Penstemon davidsonii]